MQHRGRTHRSLGGITERTIAPCVERHLMSHRINSPHGRGYLMDANAMTTLDLSGKTAVITGASRGIGAETARRMAAAGARVIVNYHSSDAAADAVVRDIGERAVAIRADVADPEAVKRMIDEAVNRFGTIDILLNNAAVF